MGQPQEWRRSAARMLGTTMPSTPERPVPPPPADRAARRVSTAWRVGALLMLALLVWAALASALSEPLSLNGLQEARLRLHRQHEMTPWALAGGWFCLFIALSALALPGAAVLALAAGSLWGLALGTAMVLLASTCGATLAFLAARRWGREGLRRRFGAQLARLDAALVRDGAWALLVLRLVPVVPYGLLNPLMGLTAMRTRTFFAVSALGMLAGTMAYVHAGQQLAQVQTLAGLLQPPMLIALAVLAALAALPLMLRPWLAGRGWR